MDLAEGRAFLQPDWGCRSLADWGRLKFQVPVTAEELTDKDPAEAKRILHERVLGLYRQREIDFPVQLGMARFMAERGTAVRKTRRSRTPIRPGWRSNERSWTVTTDGPE